MIWLLMGRRLIPSHRSLSYLRCDWSLDNQHSYVSCHVLFDSNFQVCGCFQASHSIPHSSLYFAKSLRASLEIQCNSLQGKVLVDPT